MESKRSRSASVTGMEGKDIVRGPATQGAWGKEGRMSSDGKLSRRGLLRGAGLVAGAALVKGAQAGEEQGGRFDRRGPGPVSVTLEVNGEPRKLRIEPRATLAQVLREELQ